MTQYPVPYKYIVTLRSRRLDRDRESLFVAAWTAEDTVTQTEVQYEIRGNPKSDWLVESVGPWVDRGKTSDEASVAGDT